ECDSIVCKGDDCGGMTVRIAARYLIIPQTAWRATHKFLELPARRRSNARSGALHRNAENASASAQRWHETPADTPSLAPAHARVDQVSACLIGRAVHDDCSRPRPEALSAPGVTRREAPVRATRIPALPC